MHVGNFIDVIKKITGADDIAFDPRELKLSNILYRDYRDVLADEQFKQFIESLGINYDDYVAIVEDYFRGAGTNLMGYDDVIYTVLRALGYNVFKTGRGTFLIEGVDDAQSLVIYAIGDPDSGCFMVDEIRMKAYRFGLSFIVVNGEEVYGRVYPGYPYARRSNEEYALRTISFSVDALRRMGYLSEEEAKKINYAIAIYADALEKYYNDRSGE